jgi:hypothetical protein
MVERRTPTNVASDTATKVTFIALAAQIRNEHQAVRSGLEHAIAATAAPTSGVTAQVTATATANQVDDHRCDGVTV